MRLYEILLLLLPKSFRAEYAGEIRAIHAARHRDTNPVLFWLEAVADVVVTAVGVHTEILAQDIKYAARTLHRSPGFTTTVVLVAALGIGATTAAFTMLDHVLLRPLPFPVSSELVDLYADVAGQHLRIELSPPNFRDWKRMSTSFRSMEAYTHISKNLIGQGDPERLIGAQVTGGLLSTLGIAPLFGRSFTEADDRETAAGTVMLSYRLWQTVFGADSGILGRKVVLDGEPYTVIGVMPASFLYPNRETEFWTPFRFNSDAFEDRTNTYLYGVGRLKPGVTIDSARAEMKLIAAQLERAYPKDNEKIGATLIPMRNEVSEQSRTMVIAVFGAAGCVLLIACTNLANLLLARSLGRRREMAVRAALGAGAERLRRQLLTESVLLAVAGAALGAALAYAALPLLAKLVPVSLPVAAVPHIDGRVLLFIVSIAALTAVGFGAGPSIHATGHADAESLRESSRVTASKASERTKAGLVLAQVVLCSVLLISCGLLVRALWRIQGVNPGFKADGVLTMRTTLPFPKYAPTAKRGQFYETVLSQVRAVPGVTSAGYISFLPMVMRGGIWSVKVPGFAETPGGQNVSLRFITPGFFQSMGIPVMAGEDVSERDDDKAPKVAIVSESFANRYWPGQNPIGKKFFVSFFDREVKGVVSDIKVRGLERRSEPQVYIPYRQIPDGWMPFYAPKDLVIRSENAAALGPVVREIIRRADPELPVSDIRLLEDIVAADTATRRVQLWALSVLAGLAFLLAAVGIHGLLSYSVASRTHEVGIRLALGAEPRRIVSMFVGRALLLGGAGVLAAVPLAWWAGRLLEALLAGVAPADPPAVAGAVALVFAMTMAGAILPAVRAARVDPASAIRGD